MIALRRLAALSLLPLSLALGACGTETGSGSVDVPDRAELERRAASIGSAPELIYVTEADGYALARQSVGVYGGDGFSAAYFSREQGATFMLTVDRGEAGCDQPATAPDAGEGTCEADGDLYYRAGPSQHVYERGADGHVVRVSSDRGGTDRETLREAAEAAHRADNAELHAVLPPLSETPAPIERGDLPEHGDAAPQDPPGVSG
ncbi:hypothetical protein [Streptomyces sp. WMMC1477]|uniref:hypothetical protein n=1 Tax=Streptomyces sp. WMMC1477 TaxID=3015155 RepID=UPI0022B732FE|nr:hypothetical protein [Streptomyces sp. WMMC1477]MCZ7431556.1 hypothetical protein [Streptomyces sp. WMMC1477]